MALEHARDVYTRRQEGVSIWVVRSAQVASDPAEADALFEPARDKIYRHPTFYEIPEEVKNPLSEVIPAQAQMTAGGAIGASSLAPDADRAKYVLRLADTSLIVAQQLGAWIGQAPALEEDLGVANIALDLLGQARLLLAYAGELEGRGRDEDALAFLREPSEFVNLSLVEQPNGDFADTVMRQLFLDAWQMELFEALACSRDERLAQIAAKAVKETRYHLRYSGGWVVRLGDGTAESHERTQQALQRLWPYTAELFDADPLEETIAAAGVGPHPAALASGWRARIHQVLAEATLSLPLPASYRWYGKRGEHNEHLGHLLAEMQILQRTYLLGMPGDGSHPRERAGSTQGARLGRCAARGGALAPLEQRLAERCGPRQAHRLRHRSAGRAGVEPAPPAGHAAHRLSALREPEHRAGE